MRPSLFFARTTPSRPEGFRIQFFTKNLRCEITPIGRSLSAIYFTLCYGEILPYRAPFSLPSSYTDVRDVVLLPHLIAFTKTSRSPSIWSMLVSCTSSPASFFVCFWVDLYACCLFRLGRILKQPQQNIFYRLSHVVLSSAHFRLSE